MNFAAAAVTMQGLTIRNGQDASSGVGGIYNQGAFTLTNGAVSGNVGIGIRNNAGTMILASVMISGNSGTGKDQICENRAR